LELDTFLGRDEGRRSLLFVFVFVFRRAAAVDRPPADPSGVGWSLVALTFDHSKGTGEKGKEEERKEGERWVAHLMIDGIRGRL
jgi:hypothetical protein